MHLEWLRLRTALIATITLLSSCGGNGVSDEEAAAVRSYIDQEIKSEQLVNADLDKIEYPSCQKSWDSGMPTQCGRKVFTKSMSECGWRASRWQGAESSLLDQYAGDSWLATAGRTSVLPIEERLKRMTNAPSPSETIAVLVGQGARDIVLYRCVLKDLRLIQVERLIRKTNPSF
jgi:hypothetical protein